MKHNLKIKYIITAFIILVSIFYLGDKYSHYNYTKQNRQFFLNRMYFELDNSIYRISQLEQINSEIALSDEDRDDFYRLLLSLDSIKTLSNDSSTYIHDKNSSVLTLLYFSIDMLEACLGSGLYLNGVLICNNFLEDGFISDKELKFLKTLKEDLQSIKSGMYSEKTHQENPNISLEEYGKITDPFIQKYSSYNLKNLGLGN